MQYFKGDADELKVDAVMEPIISDLSAQRSLFFAGAYETAPLGDLIFDENLSPLANAIPKGVFRLAFKEIFDAFVNVGTVEAYITVFKKIFGDNVDLTFTVPAPGKLNIVILAQGFELSDFVARYIEDNAYVFDEVIDYDGDNIAFQTLQGLTSQYEIEQMLFEMVPAGIFTNITLTFAG